MGLFTRRKKDAPEPLPTGRQEWKNEIPWGTPYSGRDLAFPVPLALDSIPALAQWFVEVFADEDDVMLDYSFRSLTDVDSILAHFEERGSERTGEVTAAAGFYAGEVLVRGFGFRWTIANIPELNMPEVLQYAIVAPHRDKSASYIINKAFKRVENGDEDSLAFFGEALLAGMNSASND